MADDSVFTVMDDPSSAKKPFEGNLNAGYLAQSGNTKSSSLTADTTMTWYGQTAALGEKAVSEYALEMCAEEMAA